MNYEFWMMNRNRAGVAPRCIGAARPNRQKAADLQNWSALPRSNCATLRFVSIKVVHSVLEYLSTVSGIRKDWKTPKHHELWFRAEDELYRKTRLQPGIYRPNERSGKRKPIRRLLAELSQLRGYWGRKCFIFSKAVSKVYTTFSTRVWPPGPVPTP